MLVEMFVQAASLKNSNQCQEENPTVFQERHTEIPMSSIASALHLKNMLEMSPGKEIPPTHYGPNMNKADERNVSTVDSMFTIFISWTLSDNLWKLFKN